MTIKLAQPTLEQADIEAAVNVLKSGWLKQGPIAQEVEGRLARMVGTEAALLVSSCTSALLLALRRLGVFDGEVILPTIGFGAPVAAAIAAGGIPVFADSDPTTPLLTRRTVEKLLTPRTKAIVAIHLYGLPCDLVGLRELSKQTGVALVEDTAYGLGTYAGNVHAGSAGRFGCMSFGAIKPITSGEGGALLCSAADCRDLIAERDYGMSRSVQGKIFTHIGINSRLTEFQVALIRSQLDRYRQLVEQREILHEQYVQTFRFARLNVSLTSPWGQSNYASLPICLPENSVRANLVSKKLAHYGIETEIPFLMHKMPAYKRYVRAIDSFRWAETWASRILCLPFHPHITAADVHTVVGALAEVLRSE